MVDWDSIFSVEVDVPSAVPSTWRTRLHGLWGVVWTALVTIAVGGTGLILYLCRPTPARYHRWLRRWGRSVCRGLGVRIEQRGRLPVTTGGPLVLVANHQCALDIPVHAALIDRPFAFLAKEALRTAPILGFILRKIPTVFVDRTTPRRALRSLRDAADRMEDGETLLIYPEGERTFRPEMVSFLRGAFLLAVRAEAPIVPITLKDSYRLMDERRLRSRPGVVHVEVGSPLSTRDRSEGDVSELMDETRRRMERLLADGSPT